MLEVTLMLTYPPKREGEVRFFIYDKLIEILAPYGGVLHFASWAAYFRFQDDFQGFMRESMEVFDAYYMPAFSENTITLAQYEQHKLLFERALNDVVSDIATIIAGYKSISDISSVSLHNVDQIKQSATILLK